jgi:putative spermidine/putrescine transport system ATP-binding protein
VPATPFVAEFVGTMNRLESTVADPESGEVDYSGILLPVEAARGRTRGERLLVLVRPETVELTPAEGDGAGLVGEVLSQTFLGPVTRLKVDAPGGELTADMAAARAAKLPVGMRVHATFPAEAARVLSLSETPASPASDPDGR